MKQNYPHTPPHKNLGRYLKTMRQRLQESLGETSGAVEIAVEQLDNYERGAERPSEDILMLLISHFGLQDDEAVKLWDLAGYDPRHRKYLDDRDDDGYDDHVHRQPAQIMLLALDNRILYTNGAEIIADKSGVVVNFNQAGPAGQPAFPVSRIGMSYDQAEQLVQTLQRALLHNKYTSGPKRLPPPASK